MCSTTSLFFGLCCRLRIGGFFVLFLNAKEGAYPQAPAGVLSSFILPLCKDRKEALWTVYIINCCGNQLLQVHVIEALP